MEEDIKKLERFIKDYRICERNCKGFTSNVTSISREEYQSLENLIKGYRELKEGCKTCVIRDDLHEYVENSIPKSKIKEKIEEVNKSLGYSPVNKILIEQVLQELMEE